MKSFFLAAIAIAFTACAVTVTHEGWRKEGVSEYETENAIAQCEYEQGKDHVEQGGFVSNCMKRQGFRWVKWTEEVYE